MRIIIAGTREMDYDTAHHAIIDALEKIETDGPPTIVSGRGGSVDSAGEMIAKQRGWEVRLFPADWDKHGKAAGPIRNKEMAANADALILVWNGRSRGSLSMLREARAAGLKVYETKIDTRDY